MNIIKGAWKTKNPFVINPWEQNLFLFCFSTKEDRDKIIEESPWSVMGNLLALVYWNPNLSLAEIDFSYVQFWVQAHGLPLGKLNKAVAEELAVKIGHLVETDCVGDGIQFNRSFLRFRVALDINEPLLPGFTMKREGLYDLWIEFKYERLSKFCYGCGRIGHDEDSCKDKEGNDHSGDYGPWLRTSGIRKTQYASRDSEQQRAYTIQSQGFTTESSISLNKKVKQVLVNEVNVKSAASMQGVQGEALARGNKDLLPFYKQTTTVSSDQPSYYVTEPPDSHNQCSSSIIDIYNGMSPIPKNVSFSFSQAELGHDISNLSIKRKALEDNLEDSGPSKRSKGIKLCHDDNLSSRLLPPPSSCSTKRRSPRRFKSVFARKTNKIVLSSTGPSLNSNSVTISNLDQSELVEAQIIEDTSGDIVDKLMGVVAAQNQPQERC